MPSFPATIFSGAVSMIIAVQLQITMVSTNTPSACVSPALTGVSHSAAAAAQGAEPEPASFENSASNIFQDNKYRDRKIADRHNRYDHVKHFYRRIFPKDDHRRDRNQYDRCVEWRDAKCIFKGRCHGIADDLADAAPADQS